MSKQRPADELTAAEQRDLIALLQQGRSSDRWPLPERYRFVLFEDKREVEPVWSGITARQRARSFA